MRPTRQRVALGWLLFGHGNRHVTAEMLYEEAKAAKVPVSLATVYNTLHQFTAAGLLKEIAIEGARAYFDTNPTPAPSFPHRGDRRAASTFPTAASRSRRLPPPPAGCEIAGVDIVVRIRRFAFRSGD